MPRVGTYAVVKAEHPTRTNWPSDYLSVVGDGIRYGIAQILKFGTLGVLNWPVFNAQEDQYLWLLGRPFAVRYDSWTLPEYDAKGRLVVGRHGWQTGFGREEIGTTRRLLVMNQELFEVEVEEEGLPTEQIQYEDIHPFREQSYLVLSFVSPEEAVDYTLLRAAFEQDEHLKELSKIRTTQLTTAEFAEHVKRITDSINAVAVEQQVVARCKSLLRNAEDVAKAKAQCEESKKAVDGVTLATPELTKAYQDGVKGRVDDTVSRAEKRRTAQLALEQVGLSPDSVCVVRPKSELTLTCPKGQKLDLFRRLVVLQGGSETIPLAGPVSCDANGAATVPLAKRNTAEMPESGRHHLVVQIPDHSKEKALDFWVVDKAEECPPAPASAPPVATPAPPPAPAPAPPATPTPPAAPSA
jgi:hypothetical protein